MPAVVLNNANGQMLGFLLIAGEFHPHVEDTSYDSVFFGVPQDKTLFDHPLSQLIQDNKGEELRLVARLRGNQCEMKAILNPQLSIELRIPDDDIGEWWFETKGAITGRGQCDFAEKK